MLWNRNARLQSRINYSCPNAPTRTDGRGVQVVVLLAQSPTWGLKFSRQVSIGPFFADFCCREAKLVIEIDGVTHETPEELANDTRRTAWLEAQGYRVIRFRNEELMGDLDAVLERIKLSL